MTIQKFELTNTEREELIVIIDKCLKKHQGFDHIDFLKDLPLDAYKLPERMVKFLNDFKYDPCEEGYCIISTGITDDERLGPTPEHWELSTNNDTCLESIMTMCLSATILGDIYGWLTQQDGRVIHDILPIRKYEQEQLGCGSREELSWHTEDAFHELRGDYLMMMCLRNHDRIPTTLSKPDYTKLTRAQIDTLFEEKYQIKPDNSHKAQNSSTERMRTLESGNARYLESAYAEMQTRALNPKKIAVLFGNKNDPCLRLDPYFMETPECPEAAKALEALLQIVSDSLIEVPLDAGEIIIIDNYEVVHGRRSFTARYDGTDRWYKRINIIRDIRRCNHVLQDKKSRIVY